MATRIYGNRLLKTLPGLATRPTPARVREALFNRWHSIIPGCHWLDLCSGSGAMAAEALCRGAACVVGIERSPQACRVIQANWQSVAQPDQQVSLLRGEVTQKLKTLAGQQFDCIYFDPPYSSSLYQPVLRAIAELNLLKIGGAIAVECSPRLPLQIEIPELRITSTKIYGNTAVVFLGWSASGAKTPVPSLVDTAGKQPQIDRPE
ncbi:MAG: 16S rRNA (guanine(966)-N(2))-methyltransferase RsmD [Aphanocapsa sp. GSE-SYN-MK-11-07L]|jgi:16S rRNA (guanine(966)-N(2))-methyltransferase RsmD|nr:16S rRNA (guanine(966)-N(2))-methyltransferase RsmD [Aphanocapsa sp. GSE-SYN-MK-11-07L]